MVVVFTQPATRIYADAIGQPFRDDAVGLPVLALSHLATGIPGVALLAACTVLLGEEVPHLVPTALAAAVLGAAGGWVGWQGSGALRTFLPARGVAA